MATRRERVPGLCLGAGWGRRRRGPRPIRHALVIRGDTGRRESNRTKQKSERGIGSRWPLAIDEYGVVESGPGRSAATRAPSMSAPDGMLGRDPRVPPVPDAAERRLRHHVHIPHDPIDGPRHGRVHHFHEPAPRYLLPHRQRESLPAGVPREA